jgi:uncharacterized metal-binding protein YceD (DUF177 family)
MTEREFSRPQRVEPLPRDGLSVSIEANLQECEALARLNGLPEIARLVARFDLTKWRRGVRVEGVVNARLTQTCVVSLEPFEVEIEEPIDVKFLPEAAKGPAPESLDDEDIDEIVDGKVDLGALAAEFLTLALDPYPRKPGAAFMAPAEPDVKKTPFDALRPLAEREEPD